MKRVLVISYYWPPSGGAGVQRWLKFVKYLRGLGWEPVIYTAENPEVPAIDNSLLSDVPENIEVIKTKIWEPFTIYKRFVGRKKEDKIKAGFLSEEKAPSKAENISVWVRGNFFVPDARKFWIKPSIKFLKKYLRENPVDAMVSTGPPHSMHLIALGLKRDLGIPWLADFRDPWTNIDFYQDLMLTGFADKKHHRLEQKVLRGADIITTIGRSLAKDLEELGKRRVDVVTNGFDSPDFSSLFEPEIEKFEICHMGSMNKDRNPVSLWSVLRDLCTSVDGFKANLRISFLGFTDYAVSKSLEENDLAHYSEIVKYIPHKEVLQRAKSASVLLLALNDTPNVKGIMPGKLFEYLALKKPIFCIGNRQGDSSRAILETRSGITVDFNDKEAMKNYLLDKYQDFKKGNGFVVDSVGTEKYSRKELTVRMASLLDEMVKNNLKH
ncbi:MAG: glycosyltransferase family 4 protein [Chlorobi bacterium]|nr:glycosyltransferase family 4 protein [Chlorobiota bacterium]